MTGVYGSNCNLIARLEKARGNYRRSDVESYDFDDLISFHCIYMPTALFSKIQVSYHCSKQPFALYWNWQVLGFATA